MATDKPSEAGREQQLQSLRIDPQRKLPRRGRIGLIFSLAIGVLIGLALALGMPKQPPAETTTPADAAAQSATPAPEEKPGDVVVTATGYVTPKRRIALSPQVMGIVVSVEVDKGDSVAEEQVLVRLDSDQYEARVREAEARLVAAQAWVAELEKGTRSEDIATARARVAELEAEVKKSERDFERARVLVTQGNVESRKMLDDAESALEMSRARLLAMRADLEKMVNGPRPEEIDRARAEVDQAQAALELARIQVEDTIIRAPSAGTVLEKLIEVGELVTPQNYGGTRGARSELLSIADLKDLQVEVDINETDVSKLRMGQPARVTLDAYEDREYEAYVREIAPEANREKATIQFKVAIKNPDEFVRPEMSARVDFLREAAPEEGEASGGSV